MEPFSNLLHTYTTVGRREPSRARRLAGARAEQIRTVERDRKCRAVALVVATDWPRDAGCHARPRGERDAGENLRVREVTGQAIQQRKQRLIEPLADVAAKTNRGMHGRLIDARVSGKRKPPGERRCAVIRL